MCLYRWYTVDGGMSLLIYQSFLHGLDELQERSRFGDALRGSAVDIRCLSILYATRMKMEVHLSSLNLSN